MHRRPGRALLVLAALAAAVAPTAITAAARADTVWLCRPGLEPNPCRGSMATTVYEPLPTRVERPPAPPAPPKIDCFYVYPTVSGQSGTNADLTIDPEQIAIAQQQAARFSSVCDVYAPIYRQLTLDSISASAEGLGDAVRLAYSDVRNAWRDYLHNHNHGRGVVLIGHSQGASMLRVLTREEIDPKPKMRARLVSALLLGGNVTVRKGRKIGGDFKRIPACQRARQLGCVIAYSTFGDPPPADSRFGRNTYRFANVFGLPTGPRLEVLCTNPGALAGGSAPLQTLVRSEPFPGRIGLGLVLMYGGVVPLALTPYIDPPGFYRGACADFGGIDVLKVEPRDAALPLYPSPDATWGLHLADVNIALGDLVSIVGGQAQGFASRR